MFHRPRFTRERKNLNQALGRNKYRWNAEVDGKLAYGFLKNSKNTERVGEENREAEGSEDEKDECLKVNPPPEVAN